MSIIKCIYVVAYTTLLYGITIHENSRVAHWLLVHGIADSKSSKNIKLLSGQKHMT